MRVGGGQQHRGFEARQFRERGQAFGDDVRVRREQVVGQHFPVGQHMDRPRAAEEEREFGAQLVEFARVARDDELRAGVGFDRFGQRQAARRAIELVPALARFWAPEAVGGAGSASRKRGSLPDARSRIWPANRLGGTGNPGGETARVIDRLARDDDRVDDLVVLEHDHEVRVEPLGDRRCLAGAAHRAALVGRRAESSVRPRPSWRRAAGFRRPSGLMATWPSTARVSANAGAARPHSHGYGQCNHRHLHRASKHGVISCGRRLDRGGNIRPAVAKSAAVAMRRLRLTALL